MENAADQLQVETLRPDGIHLCSREFLDIFWDFTKPEQSIRLQACDNLVRYLTTEVKEGELEFAFKRLIDGLGHSREIARPAFSLALGQVLGVFRDVTLQSMLVKVKDKHKLLVNRKVSRSGVFGNLFGVLSLMQSGRLMREPAVVLECVELLQALGKFKQHVRDLPNQTIVDIVNEVPEDMFENLLLRPLESDLALGLKFPQHLHVLLAVLQRFPHILNAKRLKKLLGCSALIVEENIPRLTDLLKSAANALKKVPLLPPVALELLKYSLMDKTFQLFWNRIMIDGMFKEPPGPAHYLSYRLLGTALPLLSVPQLREVLKGEVIARYGEHVISAQHKPERFKMAPEMEGFVMSFMEGCQVPEKQLSVMVGFSSLTNHGYPVVSSVWKVVQHLQPGALRGYVNWLKNTFLHPDMDKLLELTTRKQKTKQQEREMKESPAFRLRRWVASRLTSIIDDHKVKKDEEMIIEVAKFFFFHAFFSIKKTSPTIGETRFKPSVPLDPNCKILLVNSFFGLLLSLHHMPPSPGDHGAHEQPKRVLGTMADGTMWIDHLVQFAQILLSEPKSVECNKPFTPDQRLAWDSMLQSVSNLKNSKKGSSVESGAFQQLFLLLGLHFFKVPEELRDILNDLESCVDQAQKKKMKSKKKSESGQPEWVEVLVDILLSLLSQQSRQLRQVCKAVFSSVCSHVNAAVLKAILDVLNPDQTEDNNALVVVDEPEMGRKSKLNQGDAKDEETEEDGSDESDNSDDDEDLDAEDNEEAKKFRLELMKVLQKESTGLLGDNDSSEEDLSDSEMFKMDERLSELFSEQKKRSMAKKDEKARMQKEKTLVRDYKIKVLDLLEVFLARQPGNPLVLTLVEPLLKLINSGMKKGTSQQEQEFLRKVANIFKSQLCRAKMYCRNIDGRQEELHMLLDKLLTKSQKLAESSVCLYYFSACLYLVKVLRGVPPQETNENDHATSGLEFMGNVDVDRVSGMFRNCLTTFMTRRRSPLSTQMFTDLFIRFPVLCVKLLDTTAEFISSGLREHQQAQACALVTRAMQIKEVRQLMAGSPWLEFCEKVSGQMVESVKHIARDDIKLDKDKAVKVLELCQVLVKQVHVQTMPVDLQPLQTTLESLNSKVIFHKTGKLGDTYWALMKQFGVIKPKVEKPPREQEEGPVPKKKKGFLPETKKRRKRNPSVREATEQPAPTKESKPRKKVKKHTQSGKDAADAPASTTKKGKKLDPSAKEPRPETSAVVSKKVKKRKPSAKEPTADASARTKRASTAKKDTKKRGADIVSATRPVKKKK